MTEWIWLNGEIMPMSEARLGIEDRGFQFADGVYKVIRLYGGRPFAPDQHLQRLWRSAVDIQLTPPLTTNALAVEIYGLITKVGVPDGMVYLQLTRGVARGTICFRMSSSRRCCFMFGRFPRSRLRGRVKA